MEVQVRGNGIAVTDDLRQFVDRRFAKLDRLVTKVVEAKLELRHRHNRSGPDTITAQITIQTRRHLLRAEERDAEAKLAIDRAVDKLARQVRRFHDKRTNHKTARSNSHRAPSADVVLAELIDGGGELDEEPDRVVRTKRFGLKPMDVDEAIDQMELLGHDFFLFDNATEGTFSVVYRRKHGDYGLLIPDRG